MYVSTFLLIFIVRCGYSTDPDDAFPVYLRGIHWSTVQNHLKNDLSLSNDVLPTNYVIDLSINVRGHADAERSDFHGTVTVSLTIVNPVNRIDLHSVGLAIEKTELLDSRGFATSVGVTEISHDSDRETISVHTNRTLKSGDQFMLKVTYQGVARMDDNGLYENWDPKFNTSWGSNGPFVLATKNFPSGARTWFPCFDEPDKRATFEMKVNHPSGLSAYSNTNIEKTTSLGNSRTLTAFEKTQLLSTSQVALSINHLSEQTLDVKGFGKVRLIRSSNSHEYFSGSAYEKGHEYDITDIPRLITQRLEELNDFPYGENPKDKLDIIILEGTTTISTQPGLITLGRPNLWIGRGSLRDLVQVRIGNQISARSTDQAWLNQLFSRIAMNETVCKNLIVCTPMNIWESSLHERPLRDQINFPTSTNQYLTSRKRLPMLKAAHLVKLVQRFCPASVEALNKYVLDHADRFADIDDFIDALSNSCEDPDLVKEFLGDYIDQPGKPLLIVTRTEDTVIIKQTRYHSTYFDQILRDNSTRYTIPIFYTIDGKSNVKLFRKNESSITIAVPPNSLFLIDSSYDHLYLVFYENIIAPQRNVTEEERLSLTVSLPKTMVAALNIGFVKWNRIHDQLRYYTDREIFETADHYGVYFATRKLILPRSEMEYRENASRLSVLHECDDWSVPQPTWAGMFNNEAKYWRHPVNYRDNSHSLYYMHCMAEWHNETSYLNFLRTNFFGENTAIRPGIVSMLNKRSNIFYEWRDLHRFFFREAADVSNHRVNLLADFVLNHGRIENDDYYPGSSIYQDYLKELRDFVSRNPRRAAEMSTDIAMKLEREFVMNELPKWHGEDERRMQKEYFTGGP